MAKSQSEISTVKMVAAICGILGIGLAGIALPAWWHYIRCTASAEGVVVERTATSCEIQFDYVNEFGGRGSIQIPYSKISGWRSDAPPDTGHEFSVGDRIALVYPQGHPADARSKEGFVPTEPLWLGWLGVVLVIISVGLLVVGGQRDGNTRPVAAADSELRERLEAIPARSQLLNDIRIVVSLFAGFAIGMHVSVFLHELGHALGYWLSGGTVTKLVMEAPLPFGHVSGDGGSAAMSTWGGVVFGAAAAAPLVMAWRLRPQSPMRFLAFMTASFCLGNNALYLFVGSLVPFDDTLMMVALGAPRWLLLLLSIPLLVGFVFVLTSAIEAVGLSPTNSVWKWVVIVQFGLVPVPALLAVAAMFVSELQSIRFPMLWWGCTFAVCCCVATCRAYSASLAANHDFETSRLRQSWSQTIGLLVAAFLLIVVEWLAFGPA